MKRELTVYIRNGCHLCEDMLQELQCRQAEMGFSLQTVEISGKPELEALYGPKVPVLTLAGEVVCHYFLDEMALRQCFEGR